MRKVMFSLLLATAGAIGLSAAPAAEAYDSGRIYVGIGDVVFSYGEPYWRHNNERLYVVYERGYPRYYRVPAPAYYAPPPPAYVYAPSRYAYDRPGYGYGYRHRDYRDHPRWDNHRGRDRDDHRGRDRGRHDGGHRGRDRGRGGW
jgi:hypothetical protein